MPRPVDLDDDRQDYSRGQQWHARQANARKESAELKKLAETVACPPPPKGCGMPKGAACVARFPGEPPQPLNHMPAHPTRITLARKAAEA